MKNQKNKKAFSLLVAIFVIVILSLIASYIYFTSGAINKEGALQYQQAQARTLARSYTEFAILAISGHKRDATNKCLREIKADIGNPAQGLGYRVYVKISYIGSNKYLQYCNSNDIVASLSDSQDALFAIIDVYVKYKNSLNFNFTNSYANIVHWQTYHKRSIQKI